MSYFVYFTYGCKHSDKKLLSVSTCPHCGTYAEQYLTRNTFRFGVFYVPFLFIPVGRYTRCSACGAAVKIKADEYRRLKKENPDMPSVAYMRRAFTFIRELVDETAVDERTVDNIYDRLSRKIRIEKGEQHIRKIIDDYLAYLSGAAAAVAAAVQPAGNTAPAAEEQPPAAVGVPVAVAETPINVVENPVGVKYGPRGIDDIDDIPYTDELLVVEPASESLREISAGDVTKTIYNAPAFSGTAGTRHSKLQYLWLLAAVPMTMVALFFLAAAIIAIVDECAIASGASELIGFIIFALLLFVLIPCGIATLFYWLALRKKKNR